MCVEHYSGPTQLAEGAVSDLGLPQGWLDDDGHWLWEIALDVWEFWEDVRD